MVYFITDGRYTKIGVALDPEKRLRELQTGNPFKLSIAKVIDGSYEEEGKLHDMLHLYKINGEWYDWSNFNDEVIELLLSEKPSNCNSTYYGNLNHLQSFNNESKTKSLDRFTKAYKQSHDTYGAVTVQDIADATKMSVGSVRNLKSKIDKMSNGIDKPRVDFKNKKYVDSQRKITKGGESIHYDDRLKITKSRVSIKAEVSRPTVDNHWLEVGDYFNLLNEQLTDKQ